MTCLVQISDSITTQAVEEMFTSVCKWLYTFHPISEFFCLNPGGSSHKCNSESFLKL